MKDKDKDGLESSQTDKQEVRLTRKGGLKTIGIGAGALGLGLATGGAGLAATDPIAGSRVMTQRFVRSLLQNPEKASEFLVRPHEIAAEFGAELSDPDVYTIRAGLLKISRRRGGTNKGQMQST